MGSDRRWKPALAAVLYCLIGATAAAAQTAPGLNPYNDELLRLPPGERAVKLGAFLGMGCIATKPFLMGITKEGPAKGYAYWSVGCAGGGSSYMIQLAPDGQGAAMDCATLKQNGQGRECYKTF